MKKIPLFFSTSDLHFKQLSLDDYFQKNNLLLITGLVGSGKTTLAKQLGKKYHATVLMQDWLCWSECYDSEESKLILELFIEKFPEVGEFNQKQWWHKKGKITLEKRAFYKEEFFRFLMDYPKSYPQHRFILEGSELFARDPKVYDGYYFIIKGTSSLKALFQRYKRDLRKEDKKSLRSYFSYLKMVLIQSKEFHFKGRQNLNQWIKEKTRND